MNNYAPTSSSTGTIERASDDVRTDSNPQTVRLGKLFATADQIQALCLARKTAEIRITNVVPAGRINILQGEVVHAAFGNRTGMEAVIALINLNEPESEIEPDRSTDQRTITLPYPQILLEAANRKDETSAAGTLSSDPSTTPIAEQQRPVMWVMLGRNTFESKIPTGLTLLGRSDESDIVIADQTVSKRHACIQVSETEIILRDLDSTNGTFVEGKRVTETHLSGRVRLRFGTVSAILTVPPPPSGE